MMNPALMMVSAQDGLFRVNNGTQCAGLVRLMTTTRRLRCLVVKCEQGILIDDIARWAHKGCAYADLKKTSEVARREIRKQCVCVCLSGYKVIGVWPPFD